LLLHLDKVKTNKIPVIKRYSGGGTVVVDENTIFATLIGTESFLSEYMVKVYPRELMKWTETFYKIVFHKDKDFSLLGNDYAFGSQKFGGNAQCITRGGWVHHTSLLYDYNDGLMDILKMPPNIPEYRKMRPHHEFLCKLKYRYNKDEIFPLFERAIAALIQQRKEPDTVDIVNHSEIAEILERHHTPVTTYADIVLR